MFLSVGQDRKPGPQSRESPDGEDPAETRCRRLPGIPRGPEGSWLPGCPRAALRVGAVPKAGDKGGQTRGECPNWRRYILSVKCGDLC